MKLFVTLVLASATTLLLSEVQAEFPSFIKRCSKSDPDLNRCIYKNAQKAFPYIIDGVPALYLPSLTNFRVGPIDYYATENIHFYTEDGVAVTKNMMLKKIRFDPNEQILNYVLTIPYSNWRLNFKANGTILNKPILEKGYANMTFRAAEYIFETKLDRKEFNAKEYFQVSDITSSRVTMKSFDFNTFDQESVEDPLTDEQKDIFEQSLHKVQTSMEDTLSKLAAHISTLVLNTIFVIVPADEVFLP